MHSGAQKISNVDFTTIKKLSEDSLSTLFYHSLVKRFAESDTTLNYIDSNVIYYASAFARTYNPYGSSDEEKIFFDFYKQQKYTEAIPHGEAALKENPVNLKLLFRMLVCHHQLGDKENAKKYARMYFPLLNVIYQSGDGRSIETAFVVISVADEYEILSDLQLSITKQALVGETDVLTIDKKGQKPKKGEEKIKELYFNVSIPFEHLSKSFEKKE